MANEILKFGANLVPANVLSQATYASVSPSADRNVGHVPGIAKNTLENKALLQTAAAANGLAQWLDDQQNAVITITDVMPTSDWALALNAAVNASVTQATTVIVGKTRYATAAEMTAGVVSTAALTPASLVDAAGKNLTVAKGYWKLPGGMIVQWETAADDGATVDHTFAIPFPTAVLGMVATAQSAASDAVNAAVNFGVPTGTPLSTYRVGSGNSASTFNIRVIAIGY